MHQWNFVMNPLSNAQDPDGNYTRRWVPELAALPTKYVHCPWEAPAKVLADCNVRDFLLPYPLTPDTPGNIKTIEFARSSCLEFNCLHFDYLSCYRELNI
jgi:hypothetical protein